MKEVIKRPYPKEEHNARLLLNDPKALIYEAFKKEVFSNNKLNLTINTKENNLKELLLNHIEELFLNDKKHIKIRINLLEDSFNKYWCSDFAYHLLSEFYKE